MTWAKAILVGALLSSESNRGLVNSGIIQAQDTGLDTVKLFYGDRILSSLKSWTPRVKLDRCEV